MIKDITISKLMPNTMTNRHDAGAILELSCKELDLEAEATFIQRQQSQDNNKELHFVEDNFPSHFKQINEIMLTSNRK